jgi:hypothetical protein
MGCNAKKTNKQKTARENNMPCFLCGLKTHMIERKYSPNVDKNVVFNLLQHLAG